MPINCIDSGVGRAAPLFSSGLAFQNPLAGLLQSAMATLASLLASPAIDPASLSYLNNLQSALPVFSDYTAFISGTSSSFPTSVLSAPFLESARPAGASALVGLSFMQMMNTLSGGLNAQKAMCQADPNNPCALVSGIFGAVGDAGMAASNNLAAGLASIASNTLVGMTICDFVTEVITSITNLIIAGLIALLAAQQLAANYSLGKSLQGLMSNPCFAPTLGAIMTPALQMALNFPASINK